MIKLRMKEPILKDNTIHTFKRNRPRICLTMGQNLQIKQIIPKCRLNSFYNTKKTNKNNKIKPFKS